MLKNILVITHDKVGISMAGPGIRYHYISQILSKDHEVTLGSFTESYLPEKDFSRSYKTLSMDLTACSKELSRFDVVIAYWLSEQMMRSLRATGIFVIIDMYCVAPVENLVTLGLGPKPSLTEGEFRNSLDFHRNSLNFGDAFLYSNRRQLDFWMGFMFCMPNFSINFFTKKNLFNRFIEAPMGIVKQDLADHKLKDRDFLGLKDEEVAVIWNGGVWNHFDAKTVIEAMKIVYGRNRKVKLFFPGIEHPNPSVKPSAELKVALKLSDDLGVKDKNVFFQKGWVQYGERLKYLGEADIAVYSHKGSIETEFAHRTRFLDHILAGIPTVATDGDFFADKVRDEGLGIVVPVSDPEAMAVAILELAQKSKALKVRSNIEAMQKKMYWENTLKGLVELLSSDLKKLPSLEDESLDDVHLSSSNRFGYLNEVKAFAMLTGGVLKRHIKKLRP